MEASIDSPTLLVLADDLTGANDAGVQFAKRGIGSIVLVEPNAPALPSGYQVVVVNTESRHVSPEEAATRVRRMARLGLNVGVSNFFKKTDSTLRGNMGAELKALLEITGERTIPFVPAFPELGRTTRAGIHYVHGIPVSETAFAADPLSPVRESSISKVLNQTADLRVASSALSSLPAATDADCLVVDCESRADLTAIASHFRDQNRLRVLAGSAAFAEELPALLSLRASLVTKVPRRGPILFVNGSLNPRALEQVATAESEFHKIRLGPDVLLNTNPTLKFPNETQIRSKRNVLLCSVDKLEDYASFKQKATALSLDENALHLMVANRMGRVVQAFLKTGAFNTLVAFGGDTLLGIARAGDWTAFVPKTEIEPGITVAAPLGKGVLVISKAGGFGDGEVVGRILDWVA